MKKFQQNKVAMKIALSFMLGSALFLSAYAEEGEDKELHTKESNYYDKKKAESKLKWCAEKIDGAETLVGKKITIEIFNKELKETANEKNKAIGHSNLSSYIHGGYLDKKIDEINYKNCKIALDVYLGTDYYTDKVFFW